MWSGAFSKRLFIRPYPHSRWCGQISPFCFNRFSAVVFLACSATPADKHLAYVHIAGKVVTQGLRADTLPRARIVPTTMLVHDGRRPHCLVDLVLDRVYSERHRERPSASIGIRCTPPARVSGSVPVNV